MDSVVNILLVEDNPGDQLIVKRHLNCSQSPHFDVNSCSTLDSATRLVKSIDFDVILLDLTLPDSDGLETFFSLQALIPHTPIIILTGLDIQGIAAQAVREGAQDYLVKGEHLNILLIRSILYAIERKNRLSQELELAKAQVRMQSMQTFMQDVTHDLKTPLSVILTSSQLLERYVETDNNPKVTKHLEKIAKQTDRLGYMISSIIEMSQLNLLNQIDNKHIQTVDLSLLLPQLLESLEDLAHVKQITMKCNIHCRPITVEGDDSLLIRLFSNLVDNAIVHTPMSGQITVDMSQNDENAFITVCDTGVGIPTDSLPHIFKRFYRVDTSRQSQTGNNGLGLSIAKRIVELHHGDITVQSEVGKGTQFTIALPKQSDTFPIKPT